VQDYAVAQCYVDIAHDEEGMLEFCGFGRHLC
jgi:hypothetical protein